MSNLKDKYKNEKEYSKKIDLLGQIIDKANQDRSLEDLDFGIGHIERILEKKYRNLSVEEIATLHYFKGIAWGDLESYLPINPAISFYNIPPEIDIMKVKEKQLFAYRSALIGEGFEGLTDVRQVQTFTNIGNILSHSGRIIEAIEYWDEALRIAPSFTMAKGNRAHGIGVYSSLLYDGVHRSILLNEVIKSYKILKRDANTTDEAWEFFMEHSKQLNPLRKVKVLEPNWNDFNMGSKQETAYREWALRNRLFLNPLNDIRIAPLSARDPFHLPGIITKIRTGPIFQGMFNQLKQEFVSARILLYEGIHCNDTHYSDRENYLFNTLDYTAHSINVEKVKFAYRSIFSIFDKVAFFLNLYYELGIDDSDPELLSKVRLSIQKHARYKDNWLLQSIEWLLRDIFDEGYAQYLDPDTKLIRVIRNQIEHKYLKVLDLGDFTGRRKNEDGFTDNLAYNIPRDDFHDKALKLLKLTRSLLMYLSLALHVDQGIQKREMDSDTIIPPMFLGLIEDSWKR